MEIVPSRRCRHMDWCAIPETRVEFCKRCGFTLNFTAVRPDIEALTGIQDQPHLSSVFNPTATQPLGTHSYRYPPLDLAHGRQIRVLVFEGRKMQWSTSVRVGTC